MKRNREASREDPGAGRPAAQLVAALRAAVGPGRDVEGWATVDLERAEAALAGDRGPAMHSIPVVDDLLGAIGRSVLSIDGGEDVVLLEPSTEGRLAAALARHGEGVLATYVLAGPGAPSRARAAGFLLSSANTGPFGEERLISGAPRWGPFVLLVADD